MSQRDSLFQRLQEADTRLLEDVIMATLIFITISLAWTYAPPAWPQFIYYLALAVGLFGYFRYASPPPSDDDSR